MVLKEKNPILAKVYNQLPLDADEIAAPLPRRVPAPPRAAHRRHRRTSCTRRSRPASTCCFEGAQATFLDLDHGTYPFVTSSNPVAGGACTGAGVGPRYIDRVIGIAKAYVTRVGAGPFPTELFDDDRRPASSSAATSSAPTPAAAAGPGWLDAVMLRHAVRLNSLSELAITKLDVLDALDEVQGVRRLRGRRRSGSSTCPYHQSVLHKAAPVYESCRAGGSDLSEATETHHLPPRPQDYLAFLEAQVGVPIRLVGVGPGRDQFVHRDAD